VIESIMSIWSLRKGILLATQGYMEPGVSNPLNIIDKNTTARAKKCLKIASGFGGCNAAISFSVR
jgi:3-oxoacyl-[acyl-carrier-protein] synthase-1